MAFSNVRSTRSISRVAELYMMEGSEKRDDGECVDECVAEHVEWRGVVSADPVVDAPGPVRRGGGGAARLCIVDCCIEGELRVPAGYRYVNVVRGSVGRLVVAAPGVVGVYAGGDGCVVREVVLGSEALEEVDLARCGLRRVTTSASARLGRLRSLDLSDNALETYDVAADATPSLSTLDLRRNALGPVPVRLPPSLSELNVAGNPSLRLAYPDVIFSRLEEAPDPWYLIGGDCVGVITGRDAMRQHDDVLAELFEEVMDVAEPTWLDVPRFVDDAFQRINDAHHRSRREAQLSLYRTPTSMDAVAS